MLAHEGGRSTRRSGPSALVAHERADLLTLDRPGDIARGQQLEDEDRELVVAAEGDGGHVGDLEVARDDLAVAEGVELDGVGVGLRVRVVDAVHAVLAHQEGFGVDLQGALRGGGVGGEVRHPHACAEDDDAPLLQVPHGAQRDVRLGHLSHRDRRLDAGVDALLLQEVLEREAVHDRAEHAHVVGPRAVHAALLQLGAAEEVAPADDDGDLGTVAYDGGDLARDGVHHVGVDPEPAATGERLTGQLQQEAAGALAVHAGIGGFVGFGHGHGVLLVMHIARRPLPAGVVGTPCTAMASSSDQRLVPRPVGCGTRNSAPRPAGTGRDAEPVVVRTQMPTLMRTKRFRVTPASSRTFLTDFLLSLANGWSRRVTSLKKPLTRPSTILGSAASGLPSLREVSSATRRSDSTTSAGTSSRERYFGAKAAMCCATSLATSAFSLSSSTRTPICGGRSGIVRCMYVAT
ncbi:putative uridylate kinase [Streptomyces sp. Tu6071]|nr:putative uridylate kinase [Streptomyces sp. Tu6071]